ncbi:hypothetical protein CG747_26015 [Streptomyces sp. CB02959]|uniref:hypothetical protein n=1 Tax=Streptomyces sp. CB02959 TaxID=2020330 RepID=UPI000C28007E|nr:hypothetical protein [Streptomyces sp. CB02959]PJN37947.1 hypothetical protein CG747_26015 [Streptomyces sp. CB02959]
MLSPIARARITHFAAMRALARHGVHHPVARALLSAAAGAAAGAYVAGHRVFDIHTAPRRKGNHT